MYNINTMNFSLFIEFDENVKNNLQIITVHRFPEMCWMNAKLILMQGKIVQRIKL